MAPDRPVRGIGDVAAGPILHVLNDGWFMDVVGWAFEEAAPGANTFVAVGFDPHDVRVPHTAHVMGVGNDVAGLRELNSLIAQSRVAVFHNVSETLAATLASAPPSTLRVWSGWGGDYYGSTYDNYAGQLAPATRKLVHSAVRPTYWAGRALRALRLGPVLSSAAKASDVFSAPIPEDVSVFRRRFPGFHGRYSQLNYSTVEDSYATGSRPAFGKSILLGNSASPTNNHLDLLGLLTKIDLGSRKIVAPLSYGDPDYAAAVARAGRRLLGDRFTAITEFLPLDEYNAIVADCGIVMMGHLRQEGLGNVLRAIWQGARLVLDSRNPITRHLQAHGVDVGLVQKLTDDGFPGEPPSREQLEARELYLDENWSRRAVVKNVEALLALANEVTA